MKQNVLWIVLVLVIAGVLLAAVQYWISRENTGGADGLPVLWEVPDFTLTTQKGETFRTRDLKGKVWVADFIFTRCAGPCPVMTSSLRSLQEDVPEGVNFITITVDPEHDTPERLSAYAKIHDTDPERWTFLTGDKEKIYQLAMDLKITGVEHAGGFIHSTRYVLIDWRGRVRDVPDIAEQPDPMRPWTANSEEMDKLRKDIQTLADRRPSNRILALPSVNATMNATSGVLLLLGLVFIKMRRETAHKFCMLAAVIVSLLFLVSYLTYHYYMGSTKFAGVGWTRPFYFTILISHTILAALVVPLAAVTVFRGLKGTFEKHKKIARWTFPIWLYVSVSGVLVYFMLYHWFTP